MSGTSYATASVLSVDELCRLEKASSTLDSDYWFTTGSAIARFRPLSAFTIVHVEVGGARTGKSSRCCVKTEWRSHSKALAVRMLHFPPMAESLTDQVARLLSASRAAHNRAKMARAQKQTDVAVVELTAARDLRLEAHAADPAHVVSVWAPETPIHDAMMDFYVHKLGA